MSCEINYCLSVKTVETVMVILLLFANQGMSLSITSSETPTTPLEHRVTIEEAESAAVKFRPHLLLEPSCKECTSKDEEYCMKKYVIHDHCCCDTKFHEVFQYVEHACYKTNNSCKTIAKDCGVYNQLVLCCCHRTLGSKWKEKALGKSDLIQAPSALSFFIILLLELI